MRLFRWIVGGCALVGVCAACGDKVIEPAIPTASVEPMHSVTVTPATGTVFPDGVFQFTAVVDAAPGVTHAVTWVPSDSTVATIDRDGLVTAIKPGSTSIRAVAVIDPNVKGVASFLVLPALGTTAATSKR